MPAVFWKRIFAVLTFVGALCIGLLLYHVYKSIDEMRQRDILRVSSLQLLEELRTTTRTLSSLARINVTVGSDDAQKQYYQLLNVREGKALRPGASPLMPGQQLSFGQLMDLQSFTTDEHKLLHQSLTVFRALTSTDIKAMNMAARVDMGDLTTPESRAVAREALNMVFGEEYRTQTGEVLRLLDDLGASFIARLGAEEDRNMNGLGLLIMGLCVLIVVTGACLVGIGYAGHAGSTAKGRSLRLYVYIVLALIVSLAVPIWFVYMDARNIMVNALEKRQALICREVYREITVRTGLSMEMAQIMASRPSVREYVQRENSKLPLNPEVRASAREVLDSFTRGYTDTAHTLLLDKDGQVLLSTLVGSSLRKQRVLSEDMLERVQSGVSFVSFMANPETGNTEVAVLAPVMVPATTEGSREGRGTERQEYAGAVLTVLDRSNSFQVWENRIAAEERMNIFVLASDGAVVLTSRGVDRQNTVVLAGLARTLELGGQGLHYYQDGHGVERVGYFMPMPELGWTVGVSSAFASTTASVNDMLVRAMIFGAASILLAIACLTLLMQSMTRNLRIANERMNNLVDGVGMYIWSYSQPTNTYTFNPRWHMLMELPGPPQGGAWTLEHLHSTIHPDDLPQVIDIIEKCKPKEYLHFEVRHFSTSGALRHVRVLAYVEDVRAQGVVISGMAYDITAVKQVELSEEMLRDNNERMTQLMSGAGIHTWEIDARTNSLIYDAQWARNMRMPDPQAGETTVSTFFESVHPDFAELVQGLHGKMELGQYVKFDLRLRSFSGEDIWHRSIARVVAVDADGQAQAYSGMGYDITAEKMLQESEELLRQQSGSLREAHERMQNLMQATGMYMWEFDVPGNSYVYDAQWHRLMELPGTPVGGSWTLEQLFSTAHQDDVVMGVETMQNVEEGTFFNIDARHYTHNGNEVWVRIMSRVDKCGADGKVMHMSGMGYDITAIKTRELSEAEHKQQLEELVARRTAELEESRNQAEAASQAKTVFLSTVSHEIRTPMNAIVGFSHIFDRDNLTQTQKDQLDKIKLSSETLLGVINDVLDISKIEAGRLELERVAFPLHGMLDTVCSIVEFAANNKGLSLQVNVAADVPPRLMGDPKRISQILLNLMNNAVKFTSEGHVSLEVSLEEGESVRGELVSPATLAFSVTDTGIGLSEEQRSRLFKPFIQADSSVTRKYGGTGLGLAISKQLVELMGGSIGVTSTLDQGSTFSFTLCLDLPTGMDKDVIFDSTQRPLDPHTKEQLRLLEGVQVLVVEDNEINQEIARGLLEEYGMVVDIAANGRIALDMAAKTRYACIFMDMQMPVMGGLEAAAALRQMGVEAHHWDKDNEILAWLKDVPIVAMTANAMSEDKGRCLAAGMDDHIGKPIDVALLQKCLLRWALPGTFARDL